MTPREPMEELIHQLVTQTRVFRKGEVVHEEEVNGIKVVTIDGFPSTPIQEKVVDCHFVNVGFTEAAAGGKNAFVQAVAEVIDSTGGEYAEVTYKDLKGGPSYIVLGAWLGSQTLAFQFMALAEFHELGHVITPAKIHVTDEEKANELAGIGFVMGTCDIPVPA